MKNNIIPINREAVVDDALIRIVNENHARSIREQQKELIRKRKQFDRFVNNLLYTAIGAALGVLLSLLAIVL